MKEVDGRPHGDAVDAGRLLITCSVALPLMVGLGAPWWAFLIFQMAFGVLLVVMGRHLRRQEF